MAIYRSIGGPAQSKVACTTPADVIEAFGGDYANIEVAPGYYDFGSWTAVTIGSNRRIRFIGDVVFKNANLQTQTKADSDHYDSSASTVTLSGSTFTKSGGGNFAAASGWEMFVRDQWWTRSSSTTTTFVCNETPQGYGLGSAHDFVLCKPTKNIVVDGSLTVEIPAADTGTRFCGFYGLAFCDMSRWELRFVDCPANFGSWGAIVSHCADSLLPAIEVIDYDCSGSFWGAPINLWDSHRCTAYNWRAGNLQRDDISDQNLLGIQITRCYGCRVVDSCVSGTSRYNSNVGAPFACSYYIDSGTDYTYISGQSLAPYSEDGAEYHSLDYGTSNVLNIEQMAA